MNAKRVLRGLGPAALVAALGPFLSAQDPGDVTYQEWNGKPDPQVFGAAGPVQPDLFHPDHQPRDGVRPEMPEPRRGGRVIVHLAAMPRHLNLMTENSSYVRWMLREVHEFLMLRDWETWEHVPRLAEDVFLEDTVVLADDSTIFGETREEGDDLVVRPVSPDNPLTEERRIPKTEVKALARETVVTMNLHAAKWHDGHAFDADDVYFSWLCYKNPTVDCEDSRDKVGKITSAEVLGEQRIRFFFEEPYFLALDVFTDLTIIASHRYNLSDPDNPDFEEGTDPLGREQGLYVNEHELNLNWLGLGPYRITDLNEQFIEAQRFDDYFDPERAGFVDAIRWRHIASSDAAKAAVLNGEIDFWMRMLSEDYFGEFTRKPEFLENYYKGYYYVPSTQYISWNMRLPMFAERDVRRALGHCFDWDEYLRTTARGLGVRVTGTAFYLSRDYDHSIEPLAYDLERAEELLDDAGWYDRDGDGIRDKDGQPFEFDFLVSAGMTASERQALKLQENLAKVGVKMNIVARDWAAFIERIKQKDFDVFGLGWTLDVENDLFPLWHSVDETKNLRGSNYPGLADEEVDGLIEAIQRELDPDVRENARPPPPAPPVRPAALHVHLHGPAQVRHVQARTQPPPLRGHRAGLLDSRLVHRGGRRRRRAGAGVLTPNDPTASARVPVPRPPHRLDDPDPVRGQRARLRADPPRAGRPGRLPGRDHRHDRVGDRLEPGRRPAEVPRGAPPRPAALEAVPALPGALPPGPPRPPVVRR